MSREVIVREAGILLEDEAAYRSMATAANPYGDGKASGRIVEAVLARDDARAVRETAEALNG
jgi:UDP-N-acetylglucosamine 2-epimerase (non-hydrolysing)